MIWKRPAVMRWGLLGAVCFGLSKGFEAMGDALPYADQGVSGDRLLWHLTALAFLLAAAASGFCFVRGLFRRYVFESKGGSQHLTPSADASVFADEETFDADVALARYMAARDTKSPPVAPRPGGFGRKPI